MEPAQRKQRLVLLVVCGVFISVGLALFIPTALLPVLDFFQMRKWKEVPCTIVGREGFGAVYAYEVDEVRRESSSLGLEGMFCPTRDLWDLKPGSTSVCYVNPRDAAEAVLFRDLDATILLGAAPLIFVFLPGLALVLGWRNVGRPPDPDPPPVPAGPVPPSTVLLARRAGGCAVVVVFFFLVFLGGILALLWIFGGPFHLAIGLPFAALWLVLLRVLCRMLLALLNPRIALTLVPGRGAPGGEIDVRWDVVGGLRGVRRFRLELVVREEFRYRAGKHSTTRTAPIAAMDVAAGGAKELRRGSTRITLPRKMHSFRQGPVAVVWAFRLTAEIAFGPDIEDEFPFEVAPPCR